MHRKTFSLVLAAAAIAALATDASAQTKAHRQHQNRQNAARQYANERPPLTVTQRSFLDPGPVVPVGTMSTYVMANTIFSRTPDQLYQRSKFGNELLPWPLEIPARAEPIVTFETPGYPY
jgi:hypothetical protein